MITKCEKYELADRLLHFLEPLADEMYDTEDIELYWFMKDLIYPVRDLKDNNHGSK